MLHEQAHKLRGKAVDRRMDAIMRTLAVRVFKAVSERVKALWCHHSYLPIWFVDTCGQKLVCLGRLALVCWMIGSRMSWFVSVLGVLLNLTSSTSRTHTVQLPVPLMSAWGFVGCRSKAVFFLMLLP